MPLRVQCSHCDRTLLLEDAFRGAGCRCQFCRSYMRVPAGSVSPATLHRPAHPPLVTAPHTVRSKLPAPKKPASRAPASRHRVASALSTRYVRGTFLAAACGLIAVATWSIIDFSTSPTPRKIVKITAPVFNDQAAPLDGQPVTPRPGGESLAHSYFGIPVDGNLVAYIVDADEAMKPYIANLSFVTNRVNQSVFAGGAGRFGIIRPNVKKRFSLMDVAERPNALESSEATLAATLPPEGTDLYESLGVAFNSYADQVFLVMAKPIDSAEVARLAHRAEQTGAVTNVIAIGPAAQQDLSPIATATGGRFTALSDADFASWVSQYKSAVP